MKVRSNYPKVRKSTLFKVDSFGDNYLNSYMRVRILPEFGIYKSIQLYEFSTTTYSGYVDPGFYYHFGFNMWTWFESGLEMSWI